MACSVAGVTTTVVRDAELSLPSPPVVDAILSDSLAQTERGKYELATANTYEVTLNAKPRHINKGDVVAIQETLFNSTIYGVVKSVEYRLTIDDSTAIEPSMQLGILVSKGM